jgi:hypothetical protein
VSQAPIPHFVQLCRASILAPGFDIDGIAASCCLLTLQGIHIVTPNKKLGSGPLSDYLAVKQLQRAGKAHLMYEVSWRRHCCRVLLLLLLFWCLLCSGCAAAAGCCCRCFLPERHGSCSPSLPCSHPPGPVGAWLPIAVSIPDRDTLICH